MRPTGACFVYGTKISFSTRSPSKKQSGNEFVEDELDVAVVHALEHRPVESTGLDQARDDLITS